MKKITVIMLGWETKLGSETLPVAAKNNKVEAKDMCDILNDIIEHGDLNMLRTKMVQECMVIPSYLQGEPRDTYRLQKTLSFYTRECFLS